MKKIIDFQQNFYGIQIQFTIEIFSRMQMYEMLSSLDGIANLESENISEHDTGIKILGNFDKNEEGERIIVVKGNELMIGGRTPISFVAYKNYRDKVLACFKKLLSGIKPTHINMIDCGYVIDIPHLHLKEKYYEGNLLSDIFIKTFNKPDINNLEMFECRFSLGGTGDFVTFSAKPGLTRNKMKYNSFVFSFPTFGLTAKGKSGTFTQIRKLINDKDKLFQQLHQKLLLPFLKEQK